MQKSYLSPEEKQRLDEYLMSTKTRLADAEANAGKNRFDDGTVEATKHAVKRRNLMAGLHEAANDIGSSFGQTSGSSMDGYVKGQNSADLQDLEVKRNLWQQAQAEKLDAQKASVSAMGIPDQIERERAGAETARIQAGAAAEKSRRDAAGILTRDGVDDLIKTGKFRVATAAEPGAEARTVEEGGQSKVVYLKPTYGEEREDRNAQATAAREANAAEKARAAKEQRDFQLTLKFMDQEHQKSLKQFEAGMGDPSFKRLPVEDQETIKDLAGLTSKKISISNMIRSYEKRYKAAKTDEDKLAIGRQMLKVLNSSEGADAIGSEEANRLGSKLEFAMGNFTNSNPTQFGRDLKGFETQIAATLKAVDDGVKFNRAEIARLRGHTGSGTNHASTAGSGSGTEKSPAPGGGRLSQFSEEEKKGAYKFAISNKNSSDPATKEKALKILEALGDYRPPEAKLINQPPTGARPPVFGLGRGQRG